MYQKVRAYTRAKREGEGRASEAKTESQRWSKHNFKALSEYSNVLSAAT